jgi:hypothetical protein
MLLERTVARTLKRGNSPHLLTGLIFDDRGNPMSPTHANKKGVRYRYYTSHALLQRRKEHAGSIPRVPAPEVEALVCEALRRGSSVADESSHKHLITQHVAKAIIRRDRIEVERKTNADGEEVDPAGKFAIPFSLTVIAEKGITRQPPENGQMDAVAREKLLNAIRRASRWVDAVKSGEAESFEEIAAEEGLGERHVRWLAPLAFLSPRIASAIMDEAALPCISVAMLAKALPHSWATQEATWSGRRLPDGS